MNGLRYFPYATVRFDAPKHSEKRQPAPGVAEYSHLISVAYPSVRGDREADLLVIGFERRNDGPWQPPKAKERAPARRAGTDARAAWRWSRQPLGRAGSSARPAGRTGSVRGTDEGTARDALLMSQGSAL